MLYEVGKFYPMTLQDGQAVLSQMGVMSLMAKGRPDVTRGRRYVGNDYGDQWEFWLTSGQKVEFSVSLTGNIDSDHFIASITPKADPNLPEAQF